MGCPNNVNIGENFTFSVATHDADTAIRMDADAEPTYSIYEDGVDPAILTGTMPKRNSKTGLYTKTLACSAANGFEAGKTYTIDIDATVNTNPGGITYAFQVGNAVTVVAGAITFTYTITNSVTGLPIEGVEVWFTTDAVGNNVVWKGDTNAFGIAQDAVGNLPILDAGTYYVWRQKAGYTFTNPDIEVVS